MLKFLSAAAPYFFILLLLVSAPSGFSQEDSQWKDDPRYDQVPPDYYQNLQHTRSPEAVITINGWDNFDLGVDYAETHMSVNPLNPLQYMNAFNINNIHYTQDGFNWNSAVPNFGVTARGDPVTAYDSLGNLYYETMYGSISGCKVIRSTDNGMTWSAAVTSIAGNDKNWIACDQTSGPYANYVYTTMTPGNFARSTDFGATWQTTATAAAFNNTQSLPGMMTAVGPNGSIQGGCVYVVTHSGTNGAGRYTFFRSTDGGLTFTQRSQQFFSNYIGTEIGGRSTVNGMRTRPYPFITADNSYGPYRGRLYLVYASNNPSGNGNKADIFLRYSDNQASTWSSAVIVNDDANSTANHNFFPAVWCDKQTGRLYIKWYDTRLCPTSDSMDVYATYSDNGGASFAPNQRITNKTFKTKLSTTGTPPVYQGDYDAVSGINNQAMLVWTDFRNDNYGSYVAYFPDYAMTLSASSVSAGTAGDSVFFSVEVPAVKLYTSTVTFNCELTPAPAAGQIEITPVGSNILNSYPGSVVFKVKTIGWVPQGNYTISVTGKGPGGTPVHKRTLDLIVGPPKPFQLSISVYDGWNLVSIPGLHPVNQNALTWFPYMDSQAGIYEYQNGYIQVTELTPGKGYWMKHNGARVYNTGDEWPAGGINRAVHTAIAGVGGWNLIGGYEESVAAVSVTTSPPGLLQGPFYRYSGGYQVSETLTPGSGYWVRLSGFGQIIMP